MYPFCLKNPKPKPNKTLPWKLLFPHIPLTCMDLYKNHLHNAALWPSYNNHTLVWVVLTSSVRLIHASILDGLEDLISNVLLCSNATAEGA